MTYQLLHGDVIAELRKLPSESVNCVVTSAPYWGLRDYGIAPSVWGHWPFEHEHEWQDNEWRDNRHTPGAGPKQATNSGSEGWRSNPRQNDFCLRCGAWRGCLGLEPTPQFERQFVGDWHPDPAHKHAAGAVNGTAKWAKTAQAAAARMNGNVARAREARNGDPDQSNFAASSEVHNQPFLPPATLGWAPTCSHPLFPGEVVPATVLDPFAGSGRAGVVALTHGRKFIGIEARAEYVAIARWQLDQVSPDGTTPGKPCAARGAEQQSSAIGSRG